MLCHANNSSLTLPDLPFHSQSAERSVKLVTEVSHTGIYSKFDNHHKSIIKTANSFLIRLVDKHNPNSKEWMNVADLVQLRITHSSGMFDGKIFVKRKFSPEVEVYDSSENAWTYAAIDKTSTSNTRFKATLRM